MRKLNLSASKIDGNFSLDISMYSGVYDRFMATPTMVASRHPSASKCNHKTRPGRSLLQASLKWVCNQEIRATGCRWEKEGSHGIPCLPTTRDTDSSGSQAAGQHCPLWAGCPRSGLRLKYCWSLLSAGSNHPLSALRCLQSGASVEVLAWQTPPTVSSIPSFSRVERRRRVR